MNQKLMAISQGITPQLFLLLSQTVNYAVDVLEESEPSGVHHGGRQSALEAAGVPGRRQGP